MVAVCPSCNRKAHYAVDYHDFNKYLLKKSMWLESSMEKGTLKYVTAAIIISENKILITKRNITRHLGGDWEFPSGKLKNSENLEECLRREIKEELCLDIYNIKPFKLIDQDYDTFQIRLYSFICKIRDKDKLYLNEHVDFAWVGLLNELKNYSFSKADKQIVEYLAKQYSFYLL